MTLTFETERQGATIGHSKPRVPLSGYDDYEDEDENDTHYFSKKESGSSKTTEENLRYLP